MAAAHRSRAIPARAGLIGRVAFAAAAVFAVMHAGLLYTYDASGFDLSGPMAFVGLVPAAASVVAWARWQDGVWPDSAPQRGADLVIAAMLLVTGVAVAVQAPRVFGGETLAWRADLACLPLIVGGLVALVLGVRVLHRVWVAVALLALMSPAVARPLVSALDSAAQALTAAALPVLADRMPGVGYAPGGVTEYLLVAGPQGGFTVSVAQACSGAGLTLLGGLLAVTGILATRRAEGRRAVWSWAWPIAVLGLFSVANLVRLVALLSAGVSKGQQTMLESVHPVAGTVAATAAGLIALALLPVCGRRSRRSPLSDAAVVSGARVRAVLPPLRPATALGIAVVALAVAAPARAATTDHDLVTGASRQPSPSASVAMRDWEQARSLGPVSWASAYFGAGSRWERGLLPPPAGAEGVPVVQVDVVQTRQPATLDQYGLAACFRFHGYDVVDEGQRPLPDGRTAEFVVYRDRRADQIVSVLAWRQRIGGGAVERVALSHRAPSALRSSVDGLAESAAWMLWAAEQSGVARG